MMYLRWALIVIILAFLAASFSAGYKLGRARTQERVITIFTNIESKFTNIDFSVSNTGDPFYDFFVQLTNH